MGHADLVSPNILGNLKDEYPSLKIAQWFLDPLVKDGPDFDKNKSRIKILKKKLRQIKF